MAILQPQIKYGPDGNGVNVRIVIDQHWNPAIVPNEVGEKREYMRRQSHADYISFADDDDLVPKDFVAKILPFLDGVIDYVGFDVKCLVDWKDIGPVHHTLAAEGWYSDHLGHWRDISHINPIRRELALKAPMSGGFGEDWRWAAAMRGLVKTQHYIPEILYYYVSRKTPRNDAKDVLDPRRVALIESLK